jgi:hypothetical protein
MQHKATRTPITHIKLLFLSSVMDPLGKKYSSNHTAYSRKYARHFTKGEKIAENSGAGVRPHRCFRAFPGRFVISDA